MWSKDSRTVDTLRANSETNAGESNEDGAEDRRRRARNHKEAHNRGCEEDYQNKTGKKHNNTKNLKSKNSCSSSEGHWRLQQFSQVNVFTD